MAASHWAVRGTLMHAPVYEAIEVLTDHLVIISVADGTIDAIGDGPTSSSLLQQYGVAPGDVQQLKVMH